MWQQKSFARDYFSKTSEPSYKSPVNDNSSVSKGFQQKFTSKLIQSSSNSNNQADLKFQKDYKAEYKKIKEEVFDEEEVTLVKVLMALADDELTVRKKHARNDEWVDITIRKANTLLSMDKDADWQNYLKYVNIDLKFVEEQRLNLLFEYNKIVFELNKCRDELLILKQVKLDVVTFQIQNIKVIKLNHALQEQLKEEKNINKNGKLAQRRNENENLFIPASMGSLETSNTPESFEYYEAKFLTPLSSLKILQGASLRLEVMPLSFQPYSPKERPCLGIMKHTKPKTQDSSNKSVSGTVTVSESKQTTPLVPTEVKDTKQESKLNELTKLVQMLIDEKVNSDQKTQESNSKIQKAESSKSVDSSKISQDSKPKVQSSGSSISLSPKPIQKPQLKCEILDEIGINDSFRYPSDEFQEDDPSRQYQVNSNVLYYIIPHGHSLTEITQENHAPQVIAPNEPKIPHTEDDEVPDVTLSHITNQASTSSHHDPQDRWSKDRHIKLVNIIGDPGEGMLTRSMAAKLTAASASECLFADFHFNTFCHLNRSNCNSHDLAEYNMGCYFIVTKYKLRKRPQEETF
uniref:Retrovirus-related Pol polyprotein from transposon TNT 1-94 n=1 Tax=Tanacetum cinerariifolium TaxID=118510 RepID=A0A699GWJ1_TANCI|nr:retrovirus-related Pol polyprotein from transposon TNT 1-94 [Tanacetum cinerariifolium]